VEVSPGLAGVLVAQALNTSIKMMITRFIQELRWYKMKAIAPTDELHCQVPVL
jgi:hypothetical protein